MTRNVRLTIMMASVVAFGSLALPGEAAARDEEQPYPAGARPVAAPGFSVEGLLGSGLDSQYGLMAGARGGYTTDNGVYLGGNATRADRSDGATDTLLGGELGYKYFPTPKVELRPFGIVGADIASASSAPGLHPAPSATRLAIQPGILAAYHFGSFFVSAEGRLQVLPTPVAPSLLAGAGLNF
jgi:hypothetical protein